jgi:hypothetical protein
MQQELDKGDPISEIRILGVNQIGHEGGNAGICVGRATPWLQEVAESPVWTLWQVNYRDVVILDATNEVAAVYNLSAHSLDDPANYAALRTLLLEIADGDSL